MVSAFFAYNKEQLKCELFFVVQFNKQQKCGTKLQRQNLLNTVDTSSVADNKIGVSVSVVSKSENWAHCSENHFVILKKKLFN